MRKLLAGILAAACLAGPAHAIDYSPAAKRVLAEARAASGGGAWNSLRGWRETGRRDGRRYEAWRDPVRYGQRVQTGEAAGLHVHAFNGQADWQILPGGVLTGADDPATLAQARTTAFFAVNGFFYPGRFSAKGESLGVRKERGRAFDVLRIHPNGGKPRELWFDRRTHLLARIIDRTGPRPLAMELSDYRRVGPVRVAFRAVADDGDPARRQETQLETVSFLPADRTLFSLPNPSAPKPASGR